MGAWPHEQRALGNSPRVAEEDRAFTRRLVLVQAVAAGRERGPSVLISLSLSLSLSLSAFRKRGKVENRESDLLLGLSAQIQSLSRAFLQS